MMEAAVWRSDACSFSPSCGATLNVLASRRLFFLAFISNLSLLYFLLSFCLCVDFYNTTSLYACLRLACGWILWHARRVDDGLLRRRVCEALLVCYALQALVVLRAQFTDRRLLVNWAAAAVLLALAGCYGRFRFGRGGNLIKIYELPTASTLR